MEIDLIKVGKRFRYEWIFRELTFTFQQGRNYALKGANGTGKSTLMKVLSGHLSPSTGAISFNHQGQKLEAEDIYKNLSYAAPYIDLVEEFTLKEAIDFYVNFKSLMEGLGTPDVIDILAFPKAENKFIKYFSSGMKQRVKLVLSIVSDNSLLLLDEPSTNLDKQGMEWYQHLLERYAKNKTLIIASNIPEDYILCDDHLDIMDYKG